MLIATWLLHRLTVVIISMLGLLISFGIQAQSDELFVTESPAMQSRTLGDNSTAQLNAAKRLEKLKSKEKFSLAKVVNTRSLVDLISANKGKFRVTLPGRNGNDKSSQVITSAWEYTDGKNYSFSGFVPGDSTSIVGLQSKEGVLSGMIRIDNVSYTLDGEASGIGLLLQRKSISPFESCGFLDVGKVDPVIVKPSIIPEIGKAVECNNSDVRVLVMFTNNANNSGRNVRTEASTGINLLNTMFSNTGVGVRAQLADVVAFPNYVEGTDARRDLRRLGGLEETGNLGNADAALVNTINEARTLADADLVVVLVEVSANRRWGGILGIADGNIRDNVLGPPNFLALVDVATSNEDFVLQHEVGHLLGCRHERDQFPRCNRGEWLSDHNVLLLDGSEALQLGHNEDPTVGSDHASIDASCNGFLQKYQGDVSVMFSRTDFDAGIVRRKARWDVDYLPRFSTVVGTADNRAQIQDIAQQVANLQPCRPRFNATITGVGSQVLPGQRIYPVANTQNCPGTVTYEWRTSTNGTSYTSVSTSRTPTITVPSNLPNNSVFFIRLTARCSTNNEFVTVNKSVIVNGPCSSLEPCIRSEDVVDSDTLNQGLMQIFLSPNPTQSELTVQLGTFVTPDNITTTVLSSSGVIQSVGQTNPSAFLVKSSSQRTSPQVNNLILDVSHLPNGFYFIQVQTPLGQVTKAFVKN